MRWKVWLTRTAAFLGIALVVLVFGWVPYWLGGLAVTRRFQFPDRETADLAPASFGLAFEGVAFRSSDKEDVMAAAAVAPSRQRGPNLAGRPALFVANSEDRRMPKETAFELAAAAEPAASSMVAKR